MSGQRFGCGIESIHFRELPETALIAASDSALKCGFLHSIFLTAPAENGLLLLESPLMLLA